MIILQLIILVNTHHDSSWISK